MSPKANNTLSWSKQSPLGTTVTQNLILGPTSLLYKLPRQAHLFMVLRARKESKNKERIHIHLVAHHLPLESFLF